MISTSLHSPWLDRLPYEWEEIISLGKQFTLNRNEAIFHDYQLANNVYVVISGRVRLFLTSMEGNEKAIAIIGQNGLLLGNNFFVENSIYGINSITASTTEVVKINTKKFWDSVIKKPKYVNQVIEMLSMKMNLLTGHTVQLAYSSSYKRVCDTFINLALTYGNKISDNRLEITISFTQQEIAELIGATRVTVANHIKQLIDQGLISKNESSYVIENYKKLNEQLTE